MYGLSVGLEKFNFFMTQLEIIEPLFLDKTMDFGL